MGPPSGALRPAAVRVCYNVSTPRATGSACVSTPGALCAPRQLQAAASTTTKRRTARRGREFIASCGSWHTRTTVGRGHLGDAFALAPLLSAFARPTVVQGRLFRSTHSSLTHEGGCAGALLTFSTTISTGTCVGKHEGRTGDGESGGARDRKVEEAGREVGRQEWEVGRDGMGGKVSWEREGGRMETERKDGCVWGGRQRDGDRRGEASSVTETEQ